MDGIGEKLARPVPRQIELAAAWRRLVLESSRDDLWKLASLADLRKVVVILSPPRSGSSLLFEILKNSSQIISLDGEHVPLYKLHGLSFPHPPWTSDLIQGLEVPASMLRELSCDWISGLGIGPVLPEPNFDEFVESVALRLSLQWPEIFSSIDSIFECVRKARERVAAWTDRRFHLELLNCLQEMSSAFSPFYYDLPKNLLQERFGPPPDSLGPPHPDFCLEEPPFILAKPRRRPTLDEIRSKPLLLKASVDAHRLPVVHSLFSKADFKVIYLNRNPAGSINGLIDGWLYGGFFSHNLQGWAELSIPGYSDLFEWGRRWWKFDLPPDWQKITCEPLEYVCGFQWLSSHWSLLESLGSGPWRHVIQIRFEDLIASKRRRRLALAKIADFIGIPFDASLQAAVDKAPIVMATSRPAKQRWTRHRERIWPVVSQEAIVKMSRSLGYSLNNCEEWL